MQVPFRAYSMERTCNGLATNAPCGAEAFKKIVHDDQKIWLRKLCFLERKDAKNYFEHGKHGTNESFFFFVSSVFRKNINVRINVLIYVLINVSHKLFLQH